MVYEYIKYIGYYIMKIYAKWLGPIRILVFFECP